MSKSNHDLASYFFGWNSEALQLFITKYKMLLTFLALSFLCLFLSCHLLWSIMRCVVWTHYFCAKHMDNERTVKFLTVLLLSTYASFLPLYLLFIVVWFIFFLDKSILFTFSKVWVYWSFFSREEDVEILQQEIMFVCYTTSSQIYF